MVRPRKHPGTRMRMNLRVPLPLYRRMSRAALRRDLPLNDVACQALTEWCDLNAPDVEDRHK